MLNFRIFCDFIIVLIWNIEQELQKLNKQEITKCLEILKLKKDVVNKNITDIQQNILQELRNQLIQKQTVDISELRTKLKQELYNIIKLDQEIQKKENLIKSKQLIEQQDKLKQDIIKVNKQLDTLNQEKIKVNK